MTPSLAKINRMRARKSTPERRGLIRKWKRERKKRHPAREYRVGEDAVNLIKSFEGFYPRPYNDPVGHATVGYGHLLHYGKVTPADRERWNLSEPQAARLLASDLEKNYAPAVRSLGVGITQGEGDAALSFAYNLGTGALGTRFTFGRELRRGHYLTAANSLALYVFADGIKFAGLVRRRRAERKLFRS